MASFIDQQSIPYIMRSPLAETPPRNMAQRFAHHLLRAISSRRPPGEIRYPLGVFIQSFVFIFFLRALPNDLEIVRLSADATQPSRRFKDLTKMD